MRSSVWRSHYAEIHSFHDTYSRRKGKKRSIARSRRYLIEQDHWIARFLIKMLERYVIKEERWCNNFSNRLFRRFVRSLFCLYLYFVFDWCFRTWRIFNVEIVGTKTSFDTNENSIFTFSIIKKVIYAENAPLTSCIIVITHEKPHRIERIFLINNQWTANSRNI